MSAVTVGLIDGALDPKHVTLARTCWFGDEPAGDAARLHAGSIAAVIASHAPSTRFDNAIIFGPGLTTGRAEVAAAMLWLAAEPPDIVHCSFGLPGSDGTIADAAKALIDRGVVIVASAPARGQLVLPAALAGVVAVQGDARCGPQDLSWLDTDRADFGAHVMSTDGSPVRGASAAAAHFTGRLAATLARAGSAAAALAELRRRARWVGPERRSEAAPE